MVVPGAVTVATASGAGETTIPTGLMRTLSRRHVVAPLGAGLGYTNPGYHGAAAGRPGCSLDSFMYSLEMTGPFYTHGVADSDIAVVEGIMGLFDSRIGDGSLLVVGSTAGTALLLGPSVVLIINAQHMSQSTAAVVRGFSTLRTGVRVSDVIVNQVGGSRHIDIITRSVEAMGVGVLGAIPRVTGIEMPSRHLGLVIAVEQGEQLETAIESMANLTEIYIDIDRIIRLTRQPYPTEPWDPARSATPLATRHRVRVTITTDPAFSFTCVEYHELLRVAGTEVMDSNSSANELSEAEGYTVSGGFPEEHVNTLSVRDSICCDLRQAANDGTPIHGECTGLLWLLGDLGGRHICDIIPR